MMTYGANAMTDHTPDPSDAASSTTAVEAPRDRTLTWWPLVGAAVIAALVAVAIFSFGAGEDNRSGSRVDNDGALACPAGYSRSQPNGKNRVPADPSGVDGDTSLVPDVLPTFVAVCRYVPSKDPSRRKQDIPLDGRVVLSAGQRDAARQMSAAKRSTEPQVCAARYAPDKTAYLVGYTFSTGVVWVSVPGDRCVLSSNGKFVTGVDFYADAARAYTSRAWPGR